MVNTLASAPTYVAEATFVYFALLSKCLFWEASLAQEGPVFKFSSQLVLGRQCMENDMVCVFAARHIFRVGPMPFTLVSGISAPAPRMWSIFTTS